MRLMVEEPKEHTFISPILLLSCPRLPWSENKATRVSTVSQGVIFAIVGICIAGIWPCIRMVALRRRERYGMLRCVLPSCSKNLVFAVPYFRGNKARRIWSNEYDFSWNPSAPPILSQNHLNCSRLHQDPPAPTLLVNQGRRHLHNPMLGTLLTFELLNKFPVSIDFGSWNYALLLKCSIRKQGRLHQPLWSNVRFLTLDLQQLTVADVRPAKQTIRLAFAQGPKYVSGQVSGIPRLNIIVMIINIYPPSERRQPCNDKRVIVVSVHHLETSPSCSI